MEKLDIGRNYDHFCDYLEKIMKKLNDNSIN